MFPFSERGCSGCNDDNQCNAGCRCYDRVAEGASDKQVVKVEFASYIFLRSVKYVLSCIFAFNRMMMFFL